MLLNSIKTYKLGAIYRNNQLNEDETMVQRIFGLGLGATGIVGTLIIAGILLKVTNTSAGTGDVAIFSGIGIGSVLGLLGIVAVAKRVMK